MRKVLNILEAVRLLNPTIYDAETVYAATGRASPEIVEQIFDMLLNQDFSDGYNKIRHIIMEKCLSLGDVLTALAGHVRETKMETGMKVKLFKMMGDVE